MDARDYGVHGWSPVLSFTVGSMGIFEFLQMLYSLCNALATFQQLMQNFLGELNLMYALIYLDDVIVFSWTEEDHLTRLWTVFEQFREHCLKLKPSKCHFLWKEITFLGHMVLEEGMKPRDDTPCKLNGNPENLEAFNILKMKCMTAPVWAFANFRKPFLLESDASSHDLGAVLSQRQADDKYHLVACASQELKGRKEVPLFESRVPGS